MKTTNIISTPEITGNIGTCETKVAENMSRGGFYKREYQVVMTNSCTGQIIKDYTYEVYSFPIYFAFGFAMFLIFAIIATRNDRNY